VVAILRSAKPNVLAINTAMEIAALFDARIEALFVEDPELFAAAAHDFSSQISFNGRSQSPLNAEELSTQCRSMAASAFKPLTTSGAKRGIAITTRRTRDNLDTALARACTETGPWNIVVLCETASGDAQNSSSILSSGGGATALVSCGPRAKHQAGPVLILLSDASRLSGMLRTARRLNRIDGDEETRPVLALVATNDDESETLEGMVRLALADMEPDSAPRLMTTHRDSIEVLTHRICPRFILAHTADETTSTSDSDDNSINPAHWPLDAPCPVVLVR
jgi:hypothetical protein